MHRHLRRLLWGFAGLLLLPLLLLALVYVSANTTAGRALIERTTAGLTHGGVRLTGLGGHFPEALTLQRLELRDPRGLWLTIEDIRLEWSPAALLSDQAAVSRLTAGHVSMPRRPAYPRSRRPSRTHHWPQLRVERLEVARADLGAALTGQPVALTLQGSGTLTSLLEFTAQLDARRLDTVPCLYRLTAQFDAVHVQGQLDLQEQADGPLAHLLRVPTIGALAAHLSLDGPRAAVRTHLDLHAGTLSARIDGSVDARNGASDLEVTADSAQMSPRPGIGWQKLHLLGHWRGPLNAPTTGAELQAAGVVVPDVQLPVLTARLSGQGGTLSLDAQARSGLTLRSWPRDLLAGSPLTAHAVMHLKQPGHPIEVSASHALVTVSGQWRGSGADGEASLSASFRDIEPVMTRLALDLTGGATLAAQLRTTGAEALLKFSGNLSLTGGRSPLAPLLGSHATLDGAMRFTSGGFEISRAQLDAVDAQAQVHGRYGDAGLDLIWQAWLKDLSPLSPRLSGHANAQGTLRGRSPRLALAGQADGDFAVSGGPGGTLRLRLDASGLPERPLGRVQAEGLLDGAPLAIAASVLGGEGGAIDARVEQASWRSLQLGGQVHVPSAGMAPTGELKLTVSSLADLSRLIGQPLQGSARAQVTFDGAAPGGRARVRIEAQDAGLPEQPVSRLQLSGEIDSVTTTPSLALRLEASARIRDLPAELQASFHGPLRAVDLQIHAATQGDETTRSRIEADGLLDAFARQLRVGSFVAHYHGQKVRLLAPVTLSFDRGFALDRLRLGAGRAVLEAHGRLSPALALRASVHEITAEVLHPWYPELRADGRIDLDADLAGTLAEPTGTVRIVGQGLRARSGSARGLPAGNFSIEAQLQRNVAQLKLRASAGERLALQVDGQAPLNRTAPIDLKAGGKFDLVLLNPILEAGGQRLRGQATLDAQVAGTPAAPTAHGRIELRQGDIEDFPRGLHLSDVHGTLLADGPQLRLQELVAQAGSGKLTAEGTLGLGGDMPLSVKLQARDARPLASDLITIAADLDLAISGSLRRRLDAVGTLKVDRADLNIPNALPPSVAVLDVRRPGERVQPPAPSRFVMGLDLRVQAPRAIFVRGRGLNAELGGALHIRGTAAEPAISGGFEMRQGTINLAGSTLTFTSGRLGFNGTGVRRKIDPTLDFTATNISGGVTYNLHVGGVADAPVITLSSTPEQPQDQILSRLLFGADPAQLSALQIAQIAAALATMTGIGGGSLNPLTAVQRKLGLDRLAINGSTGTGAVTTAAGASAQGTSSAASIEAGRYVSRRVFVGAKQFTTGTTQAEVQVDLTRNLKIQTTLATGGAAIQGETPQNDPGSSIGLSYQFEY